MKLGLRSWPRWVPLAAALSLAAPAAALAELPVRRLSLDEALGLAGSNSYQILAARSAAAESRAQDLEAWRAYLPEIVVSERAVRSNDPVAVFGTKLRQGIFGASDFAVSRLNDPDRIDNFSTAVDVRQPLFNLDAMIGKAPPATRRRRARFRSFAPKRPWPSKWSGRTTPSSFPARTSKRSSARRNPPRVTTTKSGPRTTGDSSPKRTFSRRA